MPPATSTSASPVAIPCAASITALSPEPQTLLIVRAATEGGSPARATASFTTRAPSAGALKPLSEPRSLPVGTRTAERITASRTGLPSRRGLEAAEVAGGARQEAGAQLGIRDVGGLGEEDRRE